MTVETRKTESAATIQRDRLLGFLAADFTDRDPSGDASILIEDRVHSYPVTLTHRQDASNPYDATCETVVFQVRMRFVCVASIGGRRSSP